MAVKTKVMFGGKVVEAEELEFEPLQERWCEYRAEDGALIKVRLVVAKIVRLNLYTAEGDPVYHVLSTNVMAASVPVQLKRLDEPK